MSLDSHSITFFGLFLFLLLFSSLFSAIETSVYSLDRLQLDRMQQGQSIVSRWIHKLLQHPQRLLVTIIAGNELFNMLLATIVTEFLHQRLTMENSEELIPIINAAILTPILIVFGEITPKIMALKSNELFAKLLSGPLMLFYQLLTPVRILLFFVLRGILTVFRVPQRREDALTEEEFMSMIDVSTDAGHLDDQDRQYIENVFEFTEHKSNEIMMPLEKSFRLSSEMTLKDAIEAIRETGYSKAPVYQRDPKRVIGVVYIRDLLRYWAPGKKGGTAMTVKDVMQPALYVGEHWPITKVFKEMKRNRRQIVIVRTQVSETQGLREGIGIITMEDVIEELFGRIQDERDLEEQE